MSHNPRSVWAQQVIGKISFVRTDDDRVMGVKRASTVILCILEKLGTIVSPGGYLRRLTQMARAGQLYLENMLNDGSAYA
jgi:hypothetical protein